MKEFGGLISDFASLAWPLLAFYVFYTLKDDAKHFLSRLRRGKLFGQEVELAEDIAQMEETVTGVVRLSEAKAAPPSEKQKLVEYRDTLEKEASISSLGAFVNASRALEAEINLVLARTGWHSGRYNYSVREGFERIPSEWTGGEIIQAVREFTNLRNRIIHDREDISEKQIRKALNIAISLIEVLRRLPVAENRVNNIVELYSDSQGREAIQGFKGIILESKHPDLPPQKSVFPTTRTWYRPGQEVAIEWDMTKVVDKAYYRDPETSKMTTAWLQANEFIGKPLEEI